MPGQVVRRSEELAPDQEAGRAGAAQAPERRALRADARHAGREAPDRARLALRGEMGRLSHDRLRHAAAMPTPHPQGPGLHRALRSGRAASSPRALRTPDCVLDGEVCAIDEQGRTSFSAMQRAADPLVYYVFDLLELEGEPLVDLPFDGAADASRGDSRPPEQGRPALGGLRGRARPLEAAKEQGLEGVMAKRAHSRYEPGRRSRDWLKVKTQRAARSSSSPATRRGRAGAPARSARSSSAENAGASFATSGTAAPASPRRRSTSC